MVLYIYNVRTVPVGLKVDAEVKRGKTIHVPDSVYKKGCIRDAKHGVTVSQTRHTYMYMYIMRWACMMAKASV